MVQPFQMQNIECLTYFEKINFMKIHLINEFGDKRAVESAVLEKEQKRLNENTNSTYSLDVNWYLSNGYMTLEDMRKSIEQQ